MMNMSFSPALSHTLSLDKHGRLAVMPNPGGTTPLFAAYPAFACTGPFALSLQKNGNLVVRDKSNRTVWSTTSACESTVTGQPVCYSYTVTDAGQLVVADQTKNVTWRSSADGLTFSTIRKAQLVSNSAPELSCIWSGPHQTPSALASRDGRYIARVEDNGVLTIVDSSRQVVIFSPAGAKPGKGQGSLCIRNNGALLLMGSSGSELLWQPEYALPSAGSGPYTVRLSKTGHLQVLDGSCNVLFSSGQAASLPQRPYVASPPVRPGSKAPPPKSTSRQARPPPNKARSTTKPPPGKLPRTGKQPPPAKLRRVATSPPPPKQAVQFRSRPPAPQASPASRQPPSVASSTTTPASADAAPHCTPEKRLAPVGTACGGISLCGLEGTCPHAPCCKPELACTRRSEFAWVCA